MHRLLVMAAAAALIVLSPIPTNPAATSPKAAKRGANHGSDTTYLPDISLTDQNGKPASLASLHGRPVLVGFIHTMCQGVCQLMTAKMLAVAGDLSTESRPKVAIVLITTDPADDSPEQLLNYSRKQGVAGDDWLFLTGTHQDIGRVMHLYGVSHNDTDETMIHVLKIFLISRDGRIAHTYPGLNVSPKRVATDIGKMLKQ